MSCVGDLADVVEHCMEGVSPAEGMSHLMDTTLRISDGYLPGVTADNRWKFPDQATYVMNENIMSLFDQLCYVVVFGNVSSMMERIQQEERNLFFKGVRKFALKMRKSGEYLKRFIERNSKEMIAHEKVKATAACSAVFQDSEVWINLLQQYCFASVSSPRSFDWAQDEDNSSSDSSSSSRSEPGPGGSTSGHTSPADVDETSASKKSASPVQNPETDETGGTDKLITTILFCFGFLTMMFGLGTGGA